MYEGSYVKESMRCNSHNWCRMGVGCMRRVIEKSVGLRRRNALGSSTGAFPGTRLEANIVFEERNIVGLSLGGAYVESLGRSDGVRGREYLGIIYGKIRVRRVK